MLDTDKMSIRKSYGNQHIMVTAINTPSYNSKGDTKSLWSIDQSINSLADNKLRNQPRALWNQVIDFQPLFHMLSIK